jgi:hypothetical protein
MPPRLALLHKIISENQALRRGKDASASCFQSLRAACVNLSDNTLSSSVLEGTPEEVDAEDNSRQIALIHPSLLLDAEPDIGSSQPRRPPQKIGLVISWVETSGESIESLRSLPSLVHPRPGRPRAE